MHTNNKKRHLKKIVSFFRLTIYSVFRTIIGASQPYVESYGLCGWISCNTRSKRIVFRRRIRIFYASTDFLCAYSFSGNVYIENIFACRYIDLKQTHKLLRRKWYVSHRLWKRLPTSKIHVCYFGDDPNVLFIKYSHIHKLEITYNKNNIFT